MTVGELIEKLRAYPADVRVVVPGYEGGVDDIAEPEAVRLHLDVPALAEDWYGPHQVHDDAPVPAVLIADLRNHRRARL